MVIFLHLLYVNNAITSLSPCINNTTAAPCVQRHWWILELQQLRWSTLACPCLPPSLHFNFTLKTVAISIVWLQLLQNKLRLCSNSGGSSARHRCQGIFYQRCFFFFIYSQLNNYGKICQRLYWPTAQCILQGSLSKLGSSENLILMLQHMDSGPDPQLAPPIEAFRPAPVALTPVHCLLINQRCFST